MNSGMGWDGSGIQVVQFGMFPFLPMYIGQAWYGLTLRWEMGEGVIVQFTLPRHEEFALCPFLPMVLGWDGQALYSLRSTVVHWDGMGKCGTASFPWYIGMDSGIQA